MRIFIIFISTFFSSCTLGQQDVKMDFLIPKDYTGWVNIIFDDSSILNKSFEFSDGVVFVINKNPQYHKVSNNLFKDGLYKENYYYYDADTLIRLSYLDYPKSNIFFNRIINQKKWNANELTQNIKVYSFYVSRQLLEVDSVSIDKLPKNKMLE